MKAKIFTGDNCSYCDRALDTLRKAKIDVINNIRINKFTRIEDIEDFKRLCPGATTVPQIILNGNHIGGYTELMLLDLNNSDVEDIING